MIVFGIESRKLIAELPQHTVTEGQNVHILIVTKSDSTNLLLLLLFMCL
jgi:hypothetical protein